MQKKEGSWWAGIGLSALKNATVEGVVEEIKETVTTIVNNPPPPKSFKDAVFFPLPELFAMGEAIYDRGEKAVKGDGEAAGDIIFDGFYAFVGYTEVRATTRAIKAESKALKSELKQISKTFDNAKLKRAEVFLKNSKDWSVGSLDEAIKKFTPNVKGRLSDDGVKMIYEENNIIIKQDLENNYFRIFDNSKNQHVDLKGNLPSGNAKGLKGKEAKNYELEQTHIKNTDG